MNKTVVARFPLLWSTMVNNDIVQAPPRQPGRDNESVQKIYKLERDIDSMYTAFTASSSVTSTDAAINNIYILFINACMYVCMCVCVCVWTMTLSLIHTGLRKGLNSTWRGKRGLCSCNDEKLCVCTLLRWYLACLPVSLHWLARQNHYPVKFCLSALKTKAKDNVQINLSICLSALVN